MRSYLADQRFRYDKDIFRADHYVPEAPPTPMEMLRTIGLVLAGITYMVCVMTLLASLLAG